jgi:hypothetical protein
MVSSILCVSVAVFPSKKQNYISTGSSMTAKKHTTYLQGCYGWLIKLQLSFLLLIPNTNITWLQLVSVWCHTYDRKNSAENLLFMHYLFNDTVNNSCTYSTDWLDNSKQQIGTNLEGSVIVQFKVLSWHLIGRTEKKCSHSEYLVPQAWFKLDTTKTKALLPQPTCSVGQNKIIMGLRLSDYWTKKQRLLLACLSVAVSSSARSRLETLCERDLDSLLSFPSANNLSASALS